MTDAIQEWEDQSVPAGPDFSINVDLFAALTELLGYEPSEPEPVVVLAQYVYSVAKDYGLSDSSDLTGDHLARVIPPPLTTELIEHYFGTAEPDAWAEYLRDRLYGVLIELARDEDARRSLNKAKLLSEAAFLKIAQVGWNLEARDTRPELPIQPARISVDGQIIDADIPVARSDTKRTHVHRDVARMTWTDRTNHGVDGLGDGRAARSSGQALRMTIALLSVLIAQHLEAATPAPASGHQGAALHIERSKGRAGNPRARIEWDAERPVGAAPDPRGESNLDSDRPHLRATRQHDHASGRERVLIGRPIEVGTGYQRRAVDGELDRHWEGTGDRRVWLRGGPGLGKSFAARRIMQEAIAGQGTDREDLLVWVDAADAESVREHLSTAVDRMPHLGIAMDDDAPHRTDGQARALLERLATSDWRWLIVLDNANAPELVATGLIPTGANPNGRVLLTTTSTEHQLLGNGVAYTVGLFSPEECESYVEARLPATDLETSRALARTVEYHPLALSIAVATIRANYLRASDWIDEFAAAERMDQSADTADAGRYPHLIGAAWRIALERAAAGLPEGVLARAAMVAAIQDPDGHPTWLWGREEVADWVGGGKTLECRRGIPVAVQRLIEHGLLELLGDSWTDGRLSIHRLAARAVREASSEVLLAELASLLVNEWLIEITATPAPDPSLLRGGVLPIYELAASTKSTRQAAAAILSYAKSVTIDDLAFYELHLNQLALFLQRGGATGRAHLALLTGSVGDMEQALGMSEAARARWSQSAQTYQELVDDPSVDDRMHARSLAERADLEEKLGDPDRATATRRQSCTLYETIVERSDSIEHLGSDLVALAKLHRRLGDVTDERTVRRRIDHLSRQATLPNATAQDRTSEFNRAMTHEQLGRQLHELGRLDEARTNLLRAADGYRAIDFGWLADQAMVSLADVCIASQDWTAAEEALLNVAASDDELTDEFRTRLASVQARLGRRREARKSLRRVAKRTSSATIVPPLDLTAARRAQERFFRREGATVVSLALGKLLGDAFDYGRLEDALGLAVALADLADDNVHANPGDPELEERLADENAKAGVILLVLKRPAEAVSRLERAVRIRDTLAELDAADNRGRERLGTTLLTLGVARVQAGATAEGISALRRGTGILEHLAESETLDRSVLAELAQGYRNLADAHQSQDAPEMAAVALERCSRHWAQVIQRDQSDDEARGELAAVLAAHGWASSNLGDRDAAFDLVERAVEHRRQLASAPNASTRTRSDLSDALFLLGFLLSDDHPQRAETTLVEAAAIRERQVEADFTDLNAVDGLAKSLSVLGGVRRLMGRVEAAEADMTRATSLLRFLAEADLPVYGPLLIGLLNELESLYRELDRTTEADHASALRREIHGRLEGPEGGHATKPGE